MDQCTENFECLVIDNSVKSNKIEEVVYWYKAENHEDFKLGSPVFWNLAKQYPQTENKDYENFTGKRNEEKLGFKVQKLT